MTKLDVVEWSVLLGLFAFSAVGMGILWLTHYQPTWLLYIITGLVVGGILMGLMPFWYNVYFYLRRRGR